MKIIKLISILSVLFLAFFSGPVSAHAAVVDGSISQITYGSDLADSSVSVDYCNFTVNTAGNITIDILSWERDPDDWSWVDVNGDGEDSYIDSVVYVFNDIVAGNNLYTFNDDAPGADVGREDGSIRNNDSYISQYFEAGNYILAISDYAFDIDEAVAGLNQSCTIPYTSGVGDYGDYQITFTGDVSVVPIPGAIWLLGSGLLGLIGIQKNKKQNKRRW